MLLHHTFGYDEAKSKDLVQNLQMTYCWRRVCCSVWVSLLINNTRSVQLSRLLAVSASLACWGMVVEWSVGHILPSPHVSTQSWQLEMPFSMGTRTVVGTAADATPGGG